MIVFEIRLKNTNSLNLIKLTLLYITISKFKNIYIYYLL